ncbi:MAG: hypothetical protein E6767_13130 [Dysgonomonas sp.]|nr:hypothetical protein [Dysgonomonas sp.]
MKKLVFILLSVLSVNAFAQTELPKDSFPPLRKKPIKINEQLDNYLNLDRPKNNLSETDNSNDLRQPDVEIKTYDLNVPPLNIYVGPSPEANTFSRNPFVNDYSFRGGYIFTDNLWLSTISLRNTYPTIGSINSVGLRLNYQPVDWLIMSGGTYGAKYNLFGNHYNDIGANGAFKFIVHDRIRFNAYGQYSSNADRKKVPSMMGLYPSTYFGGTIELKVTEKFGVEGGIIRELNPFNGKWENRTVVMPVFYIK